MTYSEIQHRISAAYDAGEARAIARMIVEEMFGLSYADILCGAVEQLSATDAARLEAAVSRLEKGDPVQHVLGYADFCDNRFSVNGSVLIPRPETEWLVERGAALFDDNGRSKRILDIGTGSGCIAISMKLRLAEAYVEAWDISDEALKTAQGNAEALKADVVFRKRDALKAADGVLSCLDNQDGTTACAADGVEKWHCIVSNPPYVCDSERTDMADNVLLHEPHTALFVPDDDPLRFYRAIARYALLTLCDDGTLLFECNTRYAEATAEMLRTMGFAHAAVYDDCFGLPRFVIGGRAVSARPADIK